MSEQLGRSFEGHIEAIPASVEECVLRSVRVKRRVCAVINETCLEATEAKANLDVVLGKKWREMNVAEIDFISLYRGRKEQVIGSKQFRTEGRFNGVVGGCQ